MGTIYDQDLNVAFDIVPTMNQTSFNNRKKRDLENDIVYFDSNLNQHLLKRKSLIDGIIKDIKILKICFKMV